MINITDISVPFLPIGGTNTLNNNKINNINQQKSSINFDELLKNELINFTNDDKSRTIINENPLSEMEMIRLDEAIEKAKYNEANKSLIIVDNKMFIVDIFSKTVNNIFETKEMKNNLIKNIDSAIIA